MATTDEYAVVKSGLSTRELAEIDSFADALRLANVAAGGAENVVKSSDLGDGFTKISKADKAKLINVRCIILTYAFSSSDEYTDSEGKETSFVTMRIVTDHGDKLIVTDGGAGIYMQLLDHVAATGGFNENGAPVNQVPIVLMHGFRASSYNVNGQKATTYYLDTSL